MTLALAEAIALFLGVAGTIFAWGRPLLIDWLDVATVLVQAAALSVCCIVAFYYNDLYDFRIVRSFGGFLSRLLQSFGVAMILLAGFYWLFPDTRIAEGTFVSSLLMMLGLLLPLRAVSYGIMRRGAFADRVLIVGTGSLARKLIDEIDARPHYGYQIVGVADDESTLDEAPLRYPVLGPLPNLATIARKARVDRIIVALSERRGRMPMDQLLEAEARGILVEDGVETYEYLTKKLAIESLRPSFLVFSRGFRKTRLQLGLRRLVSLVVAALGLALSAPALALVALAIKLDSKGPVLFRHERVGPRGRHFQLLKFRTMSVSTEATTSEWVQDNQNRITRVGRWLRRFRLDELPQFINILRGDMNLVGPRPHPVSNFTLFSQQIPYYALRTSVRPGVTGWAQIRYGYANNLDEEIEKMRYDLYYIKHLSFWFDVRILFDTLRTVLSGRDATTTGMPDSTATIRATSLSRPPHPADPRVEVGHDRVAQDDTLHMAHPS